MGKTFVVLIAEDNERDIVAIRRAWNKHHILNPLYIVNDGEECLDYLHQRGKYSEPNAAPCPGILLLDIKMPKMDGLAVLKHNVQVIYSLLGVQVGKVSQQRVST